MANTDDIQQASDLILTKFECPADSGNGIKQKRGDYSREIYNKYAGGGAGTGPKSTAKVDKRRRYNVNSSKQVTGGSGTGSGASRG